MSDPSDEILRTMDVVTHIPADSAPIALVGMWHGEMRPGYQPRVSWPVVISGKLHERLREMRVKGFGVADRTIHTKEEADKLLAT
jgi:hypothetical protein